VDPDTVLLPAILKQHLLSRDMDMGVPVNLYFANCPNVPNGFYGAMELISRFAVDRLLQNMEVCRRRLPFRSGWGEDLFSQKCMDFAGVGHVGDWGLVLDSTCRGTGMQLEYCAPGRSAYHPLKSVATWERCWRQANGLRMPAVQQQQLAPRQPQRPWTLQEVPPQQPRFVPSEVGDRQLPMRVLRRFPRLPPQQRRAFPKTAVVTSDVPAWRPAADASDPRHVPRLRPQQDAMQSGHEGAQTQQQTAIDR